MNYPKPYQEAQWLPTSAKEIAALGWDEPDVILFSGDAYVDHPSFGPAVIGRVLEAEGLRVAIVPQPNWRDDLRDFRKLGKPRLFFGVTAGNMDSMVNHYTANKRLRSDDAYTSDGRAGQRPDYPTIVYTQILKRLFPEFPVVIGGIEASLRRLTHYDYWQDQLKTSILYESEADLLVYGMGEKSIIEVVRQLRAGQSFQSMTNIPQTAFLTDHSFSDTHSCDSDIRLASHEVCLADKIAYAKNFKLIETESNRWHAGRLFQPTGKKLVVVNPPWEPLSTKELDRFFDLPYTRLPHPRYKGKTIPAYEMIRHSVNLHRGCFGGCSFCTISAHQGKFISSRSETSILKEIDAVTRMPDFRGYISDLGGPSANMFAMQGHDQKICTRCRRPSCIYPSICSNLNTSHQPLLAIYRAVADHSQVKKAFIGSGIRYDLLFDDEEISEEQLSYFRQLVRHHVSGRLKVAPEHASDQVLNWMRKPSFRYFKKLNALFHEECQQAGLNQQLIPYFISSHPGCTLSDMARLMLETKKLNFKLEQVQDFTPTPMTLSTAIYYSGVDPYTLQPVYTAKTKEEKLEQRSFFFWYKPEMRLEIERKIKQLGISVDSQNQKTPGYKPEQGPKKSKKRRLS